MKWHHLLIVAFLAVLIYGLRPGSAGSAAARSVSDATAAVALTGL